MTQQFDLSREKSTQCILNTDFVRLWENGPGMGDIQIVARYVILIK